MGRYNEQTSTDIDFHRLFRFLWKKWSNDGFDATPAKQSLFGNAMAFCESVSNLSILLIKSVREYKVGLMGHQNQVRRQPFERLVKRISDDMDWFVGNIFCVNCTLYGKQIIFQNAPQRSTILHFWVLGNPSTSSLERLGCLWMVRYLHSLVLKKNRNQTADCIVRRCLLVTIFSKICTLS